MSGAYKIDVFDTGDETRWCFEVRVDGRLIGESYGNHTSKEACEEDAKKFTKYYVPVGGL